MVFHKYRIICTGIPKNASSSIYDILKNHTDQSHDHHSIIEDFQRNDSDLMESYTSFCVVRNPYDRFFSACEQIRRDSREAANDPNDVIIRREIQSREEYPNEVFIPQYKFVCFGNQVLIKNILRYENLEEDFFNFASEFNKTATFKIRKVLPKSNVSDDRKPWIDDLKNLSQDHLDYINQMYAKDFQLFNYELIKKI